jgi:hypothetical protein
MLDRHEPDQQFVDKLEWQISGEARRRNRAAASVHPLWKLARVAALVIVSMTLGAAAMGASYQIEESWRRELIEADLQVRLELARKRLQLAAEEAATIEQRVTIGVATRGEQAQMGMYVTETEAQVRLLELQLEEVRATGREPVGEVSSPVVRGRDFVTERLEVELEVAGQMLDLVQQDVDAARRRYEIGTTDRTQVEMMRLHLAEYERRVESLRNRLAIRADFVAGRISGVEAELMVRLSDTEGRAAVARQRFELMQEEVGQVRRRVDMGVEDRRSLRAYELQLAEAEADLRLAEVELEVLRQELARERQR